MENRPASHQPPQSSGPAAETDWVRRIAKARHDLRNPVAQILGFSEMLIEKAHELGYNFLKSRLELIQRLGNEMVEAINHDLEPRNIQAGASDMRGLQQQVRKQASRIAALTETLGRRPLVRQDEMMSGDLQRIRGAARHLGELSETALAFLLEGTLAPGSPGPETTPQSAGAVPAEAPGHPQAPRPTMGSVRVLVVADEAEDRERLSQILAQLGHGAEWAESGPQALELAADHAVDLILLDLKMRAGGGLQTLQLLKGNPSTRDLPVLMLAAADEMGQVVRALELGAEDYVPKPAHRALLRVRMESAMARKKLSGLTKSG